MSTSWSVGRRGALALALLLSATVLSLLPTAPAHAADRAFTSRFSANDTGDIDIVGNTLMTCPAYASGCTAAQNAGPGTVADSTLNNNNYSSVYVDVDADSSTFDSSQSTVSLPTGSTVLFAGLYWGGEVGTSGSAYNARGSVKLKVPGASTYTDLTASTIDDGSPVYQGFVDVTNAVKAAGSGAYTVANVQAITGGDRLAGWSLVVAYHDPAQPARNLSVFDGLKSINGSSAGSISVSGFQTPPAGDVHSTVGFVTYEGDLGLVGDGASLNGKALSDAIHPATNFFDSHSSRNGVLSTGNSPQYSNNLGYEHSMLSVGKDYIANGATSATIGLTTSGDVYAPGVVTVATDLYAPQVAQTKSVADLNGGRVEQGDTLRYTVSGTNSGSDGATGFVLRDPLPSDVTYVPGSIRLTQPAGTATARTDAAGDDTAEYDRTNNRVVARIGAGASATAGGLLPTNGSYTVSFDVVVNGPALAVPDGRTITNTATASFTGQSLGTAYAIESSASVTVSSPDLAVTKSHTGDIVKGADVPYTLGVKNVGSAGTQGTVTVNDIVPSGLKATAASGAGWTCSVNSAGTSVGCTRSDALGAGSSYPGITVTAHVTDGAPATVANTATVSGGGDANQANNSAVDSAPSVARTDLALIKTPDVTSAAVGAPISYALKVDNLGPSASTGSKVVDRLPAGLVYVSDDDHCVADATSSTLTCPIGALASGSSATVHVSARPAVGTAGSNLVNSASVIANETDPAGADDSASSTVSVKPLDLAVDNHIQGHPTSLIAGQSYTWLLDVASTGGSPAADTDVRFSVPAGLVVDTSALDPRCAVESGDVVCHLGTLAADATVPTIKVVAKVAADASGDLTTNATVSTSEHDSNAANNQAATTTPVTTVSDLGVQLRATPTSVSFGDDVTLTATVSNAGPGSPRTPTLTVSVPVGTTFVRADPGCTDDPSTASVTCILAPADLAPGAPALTRSIVVHVQSDVGSTIDATATVRSPTDTNPSNDTATTSAPVVKQAGLSITKTVDHAQAKPGEVVTYTLTASNAGPAAARDVVVADTLPAGVTFAGVSSSIGTCGHTGAAVSCSAGTLLPGSRAVVTITATVAPLASKVDGETHQLDVTKVETDLAVPAGSTRSATASCPSGYLATDGNVRIDHVDQDTGTLADVHVLASGATSDGGGWTGTVRNDSTGQAQTKVEVVCLTAATVAGPSHSHALLVSAPVSSTYMWTAGTWNADLTCGAGQVAIAPSFAFGVADAAVRASKQTSTGWHFTVDVPENTVATLSVRCLSTSLAVSGGHTHDLVLRQLSGSLSVPARGTADLQLTCDDDAKGIVGSYDLDAGLVSLGSDPRPKTRDFAFYNTTSRTLTAHVGLLCLGLHTGREQTVTTVTNSASASTSTPDATTADDVATASFTATGAAGPVSSPAPPAPALAASPTATVTAHAAVVRISSSGGGATVRLVAVGPVRGTHLHRGDVIARTGARLHRGTTTVRVPTSASVSKAIRHGRLHTAELQILTRSHHHLTRLIHLRR